MSGLSDQPRPRTTDDTTSTNHGGVLVLSRMHIHQTNLNVSFTPVTFEFIGVRLSSGSSCVVIAIYRTRRRYVTFLP